MHQGWIYKNVVFISASNIVLFNLDMDLDHHSSTVYMDISGHSTNEKHASYAM